MKEQLEALNQLTINLGNGGMLIVNIILAFVMFGIALGIKLETFKDVFKNPRSVIVGLFLQWVVLPAVTFIVCLLLHPLITPYVAIGMLLVASCPGGNISNFISSLSKGNVELSVSMTAVSTIFAPLITPINFWMWGSLYCRVAGVTNEIPTLEIPFMDMFLQVLLLLGLPIIVGLVFAHYHPKWTQYITRPAQVISIILFFGMIIASLTQVLTSLEQEVGVYMSILCAFVVVIIHNASALSAGYLGGTLAKVPAADRRSLTIETGIQNSGLGLVLLFNEAIFPPSEWGHIGGMVIITALWGVWHIVAGLSVARIFNRKPLKA